MNPELWQRVEQVLPEALKRSDAGREAFLNQACAGHSELREVVESLLANADEAEDFMESPALTLTSPPPQELSEGERVGPYRIVRQLGGGGMGTVYLAVRADQEYEQRVALKVLKAGLRGTEVIRRFRQERQIVAQLEHPSIASLKDGGATDDGVPYFVMEYVEGESIDRYCDRHRLGLRERIELVRKVSGAVHFFHQNLVLHRDLKPGNILVKEDGEPKLLDFGIAKLLGPDRQAPDTLAATGPTPMTLAYASPEQLRGEPVSTASDVYSLGVLLYELLTGCQPYPPTCSREERLEQIGGKGPEPPSRAVRWRKGDGVEAGGKTAAPPRKLSGDLDSIVLKALAQAPRRRYSSAEQFADDLKRYLDGLPVRARKPTATYRLRKLVWRHLSAVVTLLAGILVLAGFSIQMKILKDRADVLKTQADLKSIQAEVVNDFLVDLFYSAHLSKSEGEDVTAKELLDEGVRRIRDELEEQSGQRAALLGVMGCAYRGLARYEKAKELLEESLRVRRGHDASPEDLASSLMELAHLREKMGHYAKAVELSREALAVLRHQKVTDERIAQAINRLARSLRHHGELVPAEELYREALEVRLRLFGAEHAHVAKTLNDLALCLLHLGKLDEAEVRCREALNQRIRIHGQISGEVAVTMNNCALVSLEKSDLATAESMLRDSLEIRREVYGPGHPKVTSVLNTLVYLLSLGGNFAEAEVMYSEAFEILRRSYEPEHPMVGKLLRNQAALLLAKGDPLQAESAARRTLRIFHKAYSADHWRIADAESVLGACLVEQGRFEEAGPVLRRSYLALKSSRGERGRRTREALERLNRFSRLQSESR